jgi:OmpA-OmpF porin, OOP family
MKARFPIHAEKNMKSTRHAGAFGLAALAAMASPLAIAQDTGWYGGANVGRSAATIDDARIRSGLQTEGLGTSSISDRNRSTGYKLFGGYQLNRNLAVEAGWFDLGRFGYTATTVPSGTLGGDIRVKGVNLDLVGLWPITDRFSAFARIGATSARTTGSFAATGAATMPYASANPGKRAANLKAGLGVMYDFNESWAMRLEGERYRINDAVGNKGDIDMLSVGLVYRFGAHTPTRVAAAPPPMPAAAPVVQAPPPPPPPAAPMPPPAPAPAAPMRVSLSADALFDFDRATLKPSGREALDKLAADLRGVQYDAIQVTGHTDRLGPHDYNMKLSTRRAEAVGAYLVQSGGITPGKISARGVDGADPVTKAGDCKGNRPTPALIACLQPDRRVDVEVTGTR